MANLLVTNDDGVKSLLWSRLCDALEKAGHTVFGVAPEKDHSWISCAQTIGREISIKEIAKHRWAVDGTPADCAGVAPYLFNGNFDVVISGINIGINTRLPMVIASGTIGAAAMASMMGEKVGSKAIAFSYAMPREYSAQAKANGGIVPQTQSATETMIDHCVRRVNRLLKEKEFFGRIHNVNFPATVTANTEWKQAPMAVTTILQYFEKLPNGNFKHNPKFDKPLNSGQTEFGAIGEGKITESILDYTALSAPLSSAPQAALR